MHTLPEKVFQIDYNSFSQLVELDLHQLHNKHFDCVIGKLRNGIFPASIIATRTFKPLGVIEVSRNKNEDPLLFLPSEFQNIPKKDFTILLVDSICGSGFSMEKSIRFLKKEGYKFITYATFSDYKSKIIPDIIGRYEERFIQPPWEWTTFTPQSHLDRILNGNKGSKEDMYCIGFSSDFCHQLFYEYHDLKEYFSWEKIYDGDTVDSSTIEEMKTVHYSIIESKSEFIKNNGITHFIEDDQNTAIILSELCPVSNIIYFDGSNIHKIFSTKIDINELLKLKFL